MNITTQESAAVPPSETSRFRDDYLHAYRVMLRARLLEEKIASLYRAGKIYGGVFLGKGQEALSVSLGLALRPGDIFAPLIRDQAARLAFGESMLDPLRTYLGSRRGPMRGRDGNIHRGYPRQGTMAMISHLGAMVSVVAGALMARRFQNRPGAVGATSIGDGGTSTGAFHEGLNLAAVEKLPLVVVVANNQYAYSTPTSRQFACADLVDRAAGYGVHGESLDGTDLAQCLPVLRAAVQRARDGQGPQLIVASLLRLAGHGEHDDASYVDSVLKTLPASRDCLLAAEAHILASQWATPPQIAAWRLEKELEIDAAVAIAQREPAPDPGEEDWRALSSDSLYDGVLPPS